MDVCGSLHKHSSAETPRTPLVTADKNNALHGVSSRRPRTREITSRYKSPFQPTVSVPRRCPSPNLTRTLSSEAQLGSKRALSAERKRPSTPPSPPSPSTPVNDSSVDNTKLSSRRLSTGGRLPESLWPSKMRSHSVSVQSDAISIPISKKEIPVTNVPLDRTLRPSSNVAHKQTEAYSTLSRKPTPERKMSPLKGKNAPDQSENSKPIDSSQTRLIDQHRWPSRIGGKISSNPLSKSVDLADKVLRNSGTLVKGTGIPSLRRASIDGSFSRPLQKSSSDAASWLLTLDETDIVGSEAKSVDDNSLRISGRFKLSSISSSERSILAASTVRSQSLPTPGSRPPSPSKNSVLSSSRGISPSQTRPSTPSPRGISPSRIRSSTTASQSSGSTSVLSFIADFRKGKKSASYIDDAHHLQLLYNRYLQWRFANARAEAVPHIQKVIAEETLYNVWDATISLWDSVISKKINLQQLKLELKLNSILNDQMAYIDDRASLERDHIGSLSGIVADLKASTARVPITGGARADIESLKGAICSAVNVMQAMGSYICSLLSRFEEMNNLVSELAVVAAQGKAMLDEYEALLASTAAMQVEEYSLRTHLIQKRRALELWRRDE